MKTRIITGIIGIPILLWFIITGGLPLAGLVFLLMIIGFYEFNKMVTHNEYHFLLIPVAIGGSVMLLTMVLKWQSWASMGIMTAFVLIFVATIVRYPHIKLESVGLSFLGLIYIGWTLPHLVAISRLNNGTTMLLYLFFAIWSSDSGAYFFGKFFGRHKLAPQISPNKTVEGSIGGIIATVIILGIVNHVLQLFMFFEVVIIAIILSILGQVGDLVESLIKRYLGVKDSGNIIPGHGGVLDRFDSIIMAAPIMYYVVLLLNVWGVRF